MNILYTISSQWTVKWLEIINMSFWNLQDDLALNDTKDRSKRSIAMLKWYRVEYYKVNIQIGKEFNQIIIEKHITRILVCVCVFQAFFPLQMYENISNWVELDCLSWSSYYHLAQLLIVGSYPLNQSLNSFLIILDALIHASQFIADLVHAAHIPAALIPTALIHTTALLGC